MLHCHIDCHQPCDRAQLGKQSMPIAESFIEPNHTATIASITLITKAIQNPKYKPADQKNWNSTTGSVKHSSMLKPMPAVKAATARTTVLVLPLPRAWQALRDSEYLGTHICPPHLLQNEKRGSCGQPKQTSSDGYGTPRGTVHRGLDNASDTSSETHAPNGIVKPRNRQLLDSPERRIRRAGQVANVTPDHAGRPRFCSRLRRLHRRWLMTFSMNRSSNSAACAP